MATSDDDLVDEDEDDAVLEDQLDAMDAMDDLADDDFAALQESWDAGQDHAAQRLADDEYIRLTCEAVNLAATWLGMMRELINFIYAGGNLLHSRRRWNRDATFPYWFGWGMRTTQQIRALRRKIVRMHSWFTPGKGATGLRIIVVKERFGFFPGSQALWSMAPTMWATVDHPCVTVRDGRCRRIGGQNDDDRRLARALARQRPLAARRSPTNWAIVAREIGTGNIRHPV